MKIVFRVVANGICTGLLFWSPFSVLAQEPPNAPAPAPSAAVSATPVPAASPHAAAEAVPTPGATPVATPTPAPKPTLETLAPGKGVDSLSDSDVKQALEVIRANYLNSAALSEEALARAGLQGVLERLGPGVTLAQPGTAPETESPVRAEILDDRIGYIRVGALTADHLTEFDAALGNFASKGLGSLILDFRATPPSSDFELAAEYIRRLTPKGKLLFNVRRPSAKQEQMFTSNQEPAFQGVIVSLVNKNTAGAAEVIAGVLRTVQNALVIGKQTSGEAAEFTELPLRGGKVVRIAVAEVKLPEDAVIFPTGLKPDLTVTVPTKLEKELLEVGLEKGVSGLVFETERARLNEAALVAGVNPELDEAAANQKSGSSKTKNLSDPALQRAVDLITTIGIFRQKQ